MYRVAPGEPAHRIATARSLAHVLVAGRLVPSAWLPMTFGHYGKDSHL